MVKSFERGGEFSEIDSKEVQIQKSISALEAAARVMGTDIQTIAHRLQSMPEMAKQMPVLKNLSKEQVLEVCQRISEKFESVDDQAA